MKRNKASIEAMGLEVGPLVYLYILGFQINWVYAIFLEFSQYVISAFFLPSFW